MKFVRAEDGEEEAYFTRQTYYRNLFEQFLEQNEFDAKIRENEHGVLVSKVKKNNNKYFRYHQFDRLVNAFYLNYNEIQNLS